MKDSDGLLPSSEGKRVRFDGKSRTVVDGPFTGDLVAGYWLWEYDRTIWNVMERLCTWTRKIEAISLEDRIVMESGIVFIVGDFPWTKSRLLVHMGSDEVFSVGRRFCR